MIKRIGRTTLAREVVNQLAELILKGAWGPGEQIPSEKELATRFGVGRSTIREALQSLVVIGILETRPGGRSYIQEPNSELLSGAFHWGLLLSPRNLHDLTEVRIHVEGECAGLAAARRNEQDLVELLDAHHNVIANRADDVRFMEADNLYHKRIAEASKNLIFVNLVATIQSLVRLWYPSVYKIADTKDLTLLEHEKIYDAICSGNVQGAREAMQIHLESAAKRLGQVLVQRDTSS